jgi:hypothetical protein
MRFGVVVLMSNPRTFDPAVPRAEIAEGSDAIVEGRHDHIPYRRQGLAVIHPQRIAPTVKSTSVDPYLEDEG